MSDFSFTARTSKASPQLFHALRAGQAHQAGVPDRPQGGRVAAGVPEDQAERRARLRLRARTATRTRAEPHDAFSLNFVKLSYDYAPQKADGSLDAPVHGGWDTDEERQDLKPPPSPPAAGTAARLREALAAAGLHRRRDRAAPAHERRADLHARRPRGVPAPARGRARPPVDADRAPAARRRRAARTSSAELLVEAGLAELRDGSLRGLVRVVPHDDLLIASDRLDVEGADRVAGVHRPSATLAHLTIREPVERALDALHRERDPGAPALPPRRPRRRDRRERARAGLRRLQPRPQRRRERRAPRREACSSPSSASASAASPATRPTSSRRTPSSPSATAASPATGSASCSRAGCRACSSPAASRR